MRNINPLTVNNLLGFFLPVVVVGLGSPLGQMKQESPNPPAGCRFVHRCCQPAAQPEWRSPGLASSSSKKVHLSNNTFNGSIVALAVYGQPATTRKYTDLFYGGTSLVLLVNLCAVFAAAAAQIPNSWQVARSSFVGGEFLVFLVFFSTEPSTWHGLWNQRKDGGLVKHYAKCCKI